MPENSTTEEARKTALVFMDTETTGLALTDDIWEFAAIRREPDGTETETHLFIEHDRKKCANLPLAFREDHHARYLDHKEYTRSQAASAIADVFRNGKPHVVGAVPNFDTERITRLLNEFNYTPGWHYHLIDVENLAVGYLAGKHDQILDLPWDSDFLSAQLGITIPETERHTAMGDAKWAQRIYDQVMAASPRQVPSRSRVLSVPTSRED